MLNMSYPLLHSNNFNTKINEIFKNIPNVEIKRLMDKDGKKLESYQLFVQKFMNENTPYRGILLYHGVGTGKTCSAIAIADMFAGVRDVVVIVPGAQLEANFKNEIRMCGNIEQPKEHTFYRYTGLKSAKLETLIEDRTLDNKIVIIDESHGFISRLTGDSPTAILMHKWVFGAKNTRFVLLTGTPIINKPNELAVLFNLIHGKIEMLEITTKNIHSDLQKILQNNPYVDFVEVSKNMKTAIITPIPYYFKKLSDGLIRKDIDYAPENITDFKSKIEDILSSNTIEKIEIKEANLFPEDDNFDNFFIDENLDLIEEHKSILSNRIRGLVSSAGFKQDDPIREGNIQIIEKPNYPKTIIHDYDKIEMSAMQFINYETERIKEIQLDKKNKTQRSMKKDVKEIQTFLANSIRKCNGSFHNIDTKGISKANNNEHLYQERLKKHLDDYKTKETKLVAIKDISPKFHAIIKRIEDAQNKNEKNVIYSHLINNEGGLLTFMEMLRSLGWVEYDENKPNNSSKVFASLVLKKDIEYENIRKIFNSEPPDDAKDNTEGKIINTLFIAKQSAEGITLRHTRHLHIIESHWNINREEQIIGRVSRKNSHSALGIEQRTVNIYRYKSVFPNDVNKNSDNYQKLIRNDNNMTSDELVISVSERKENVIRKFLDILYTSSVDCKENYFAEKCYENDITFHPLIDGKTVNKLDKFMNIIIPNKKWIPKRFHGIRANYDEFTKTIYFGNIKFAKYDKDEKNFYLFLN
jgi:hypothetical protein